MFRVGGSLRVLTVFISINKAGAGFCFKCFFYYEWGASVSRWPLGELTVNVQPHPLCADPFLILGFTLVPASVLNPDPRDVQRGTARVGEVLRQDTRRAVNLCWLLWIPDGTLSTPKDL